MPPPAEESPIPQVIPTVDQNQAAISNGKYETAQVLFLDIVGFTRRPAAKQVLVLEKLQEIVCATPTFGAAKSKKELIALPTGDGIALVFLTAMGGSGKAITCAKEIAEAIFKYNQSTLEDEDKINIRMGIHSGNVVRVFDINKRPNVAGEGINTAQRVMDCGDIGHILLSEHAHHVLPGVPDWKAHCEHLGLIKVKHDQEVNLYSLCQDQIGNQNPPEKIRVQREASDRLTQIMDEIKKADRNRRRRLWTLAISLFAILATVLAITPWVVKKPYSRPTLAVKPFTAKTAEKYSSRAVSKGLTEDFIRGLQFLGDSPTNKTSTADKNSPNQLARYTLTGTVEANDDGSLDTSSESDPKFDVAVTVNVVDNETGKVWTRSYTRPFDQLIKLQESVIKEVSEEVGVPANRGPDDARRIKAHWNYLLGRFWSFQRTLAQGEVKKKLTDRAIKKYKAARENRSDPYYALAAAGLADIYLSGVVDLKQKEAQELALGWALEAAEASRTSEEEVAEAYAALGTEKWWLERDFVTAGIAFQLAKEINPSIADNRKRYSAFLAALGKTGDAANEMKEALELEPESQIFQLANGQNLVFAERYDDAINQLEKLVANNPRRYDAYPFLAIALERSNRGQLALEKLNRLEELEKTRFVPDSDFLGMKAYLNARLGDTGKALELVENLEKKYYSKDNNGKVSPYSIAFVYAALPNMSDTAFLWLTKAVDESDPRVNWLKVDPRLSNLRESSGRAFDDLLKKAGLPAQTENSLTARNYSR